MRNSKLPESLTLFGRQFCDVGSGLYEPWISRAEADFVRYPCCANNVNGISCRHPDFLAMAELHGGLGFAGRKIFTRIDPVTVPPIIPEGSLGRYEWLGAPYVAFSLRDALSSYGKDYAGVRHAPKKFRFTDRSAKSVGSGTRTILSLHGSDTLIESMTNELGIEGAAKKIAALGFDFVVPPDYSAFHGEGVCMHRLNQVRSFFFAEKLIENGANVIPHIFPSNSVNLPLYIEMIQESKLSMVAINAQMCKSDEDRRFLVQVLFELLTALPKLHILLHGGSLTSLKRLGGLLARVHITNRTAVQLALSSQMHTYDSAQDVFVRSYSSDPKPLLATMNIEAYYRKWHEYTILETVTPETLRHVQARIFELGQQ